MATFHAMEGAGGEPVIRAYVKGAPDVVLAWTTHGLMPDGSAKLLDAEDRRKILAENERIAGAGLRVLAFAEAEFDPSTFDPGADLMPLMQGLMMTAFVGQVDPPRPEVKDAIETAKKAGIRVRMITGDHRSRPRPSAGNSAWRPAGRVTGAELDCPERPRGRREHARRDPGLRPRHARAQAAHRRGPAGARGGGGHDRGRRERRPGAQAADIGIAMGITGTEVAKEAANMVLAGRRLRDDHCGHRGGGGRSTTTFRSFCGSRSAISSCSSWPSSGPRSSRSPARPSSAPSRCSGYIC